VLPAAEFDNWLLEQRSVQAEGTSDLGENIWTGVCATCHGLQGEGGYGPAIATSSVLTDPAAVEAVVRNGVARPGRPVMPPVGEGWSDEQMKALTDYLQERFGGGQG
jgi:cytochrome c oxidase subunit II